MVDRLQQPLKKGIFDPNFSSPCNLRSFFMSCNRQWRTKIRSMRRIEAFDKSPQLRFASRPQYLVFGSCKCYAVCLCMLPTYSRILLAQLRVASGVILFHAGYADGDASAVRTLPAHGPTKLPHESIRRCVVLNDTHRFCRSLCGMRRDPVCPTHAKSRVNVESAAMEMPPIRAAHQRGQSAASSSGRLSSCCLQPSLFRDYVDKTCFALAPGRSCSVLPEPSVYPYLASYSRTPAVLYVG